MIYTPEQIREMLDAATPGPWWWRVGIQADSDTYLMGGGSNLVMDFRRRAMQRAIARFNVDGIMHRADELAVPRKGQEHNAAWNSTLTHPDAVLIQEAPTIIGDLLAEVTRLRTLAETAFLEGVDKGRGCAEHHKSSLWLVSEARAALGDGK